MAYYSFSNKIGPSLTTSIVSPTDYDPMAVVTPSDVTGPSDYQAYYGLGDIVFPQYDPTISLPDIQVMDDPIVTADVVGQPVPGAMPAVDWQKWAAVGAGVAGGIILMKLLLKR